MDLGQIVAGGSVSLKADVQLPRPDKTTRPVSIELKVIARDARASAKAGDFAGFQSLSLRVLEDGKEAAALTAENGAIDASRKSLKSESLLVTGDGALIQAIVSNPDILSAFPPAIASKLQRIDRSQLQAAWVTALREITAMPDVQARLTGYGFEPLGNTPAQFMQVFTADYPRVAELIKAAGVTAQ